MRLKDGLATRYGPGPRHRSAWQWFPWAVAGSMLVVIAVNVTMVSFALGTFPGQAGSDGFDLSNHYDRVLDRVQRDAALGWSLRLQADDAGRPVLLLTDRSGAPLRDAQIEGVATRPLGPPETTPLVFRNDGPGRYVAAVALPSPGQWEIQFQASARGRTIAATRRMVVGIPPGTPLPHERERSARSAG